MILHNMSKWVIFKNLLVSSRISTKVTDFLNLLKYLAVLQYFTNEITIYEYLVILLMILL